MTTNNQSLLPRQFGPLQGVRILSTGHLIAQPFAAAIAAEMGAEVIQIELPTIGDAVCWAWRTLKKNGETPTQTWIPWKASSSTPFLEVGWRSAQ